MKKVFIISIFIVTGICSAKGQGIFKPIDQYHFINIDSNKIIYPDNYNTLELFFRKLDKLIFFGKGQVNIVHIGGSHIQADIISHRFRTNLLSIQPGLVSGRGLIFPYSIAKTNNPWNYKTSFTGKWTAVRNVQKDLKTKLGVTGIAVLTSDSTAEFSVEMRKSVLPDFNFNTIKILCSGNSSEIEPVLIYKDMKISKTEYDSAMNMYVFRLPVRISSFTVGFKGFRNSGQSIGINGILLEDDKPGIIYHSIGVNGASVPSYLKCENFKRDLSLLHPDLIIFAIGINDASSSTFSPSAFESNYTSLIRSARETNPFAALLFSVNNDTFRKSGRRYEINDNNSLAREVFFKLAVDHKGAIWDLYTIMGGRGSIAKWEEAGLAKTDKIHFTTAGYELLGDLLFNAFWDAYSDYIKTTVQLNKSFRE